jgi:hypothetical protein
MYLIVIRNKRKTWTSCVDAPNREEAFVMFAKHMNMMDYLGIVAPMLIGGTISIVACCPGNMFQDVEYIKFEEHPLRTLLAKHLTRTRHQFERERLTGEEPVYRLVK